MTEVALWKMLADLESAYPSLDDHAALKPARDASRVGQVVPLSESTISLIRELHSQVCNTSR